MNNRSLHFNGRHHMMSNLTLSLKNIPVGYDVVALLKIKNADLELSFVLLFVPRNR